MNMTTVLALYNS